MAGANGELYDSQSEAEFHAKFPNFAHHCCKIPYTSFHEYHPDFIINTDKGRLIVEIKGFFMDSKESRKYKDIREALDDGDELVFVFDKPNSKLPWSTKRKDGSYFTHKEWATRNGFRSFDKYCTLEDLLGDHK